ncbi:antirepressor [Rodentibacter ratti]|uniref:Antirepressor n=1 Tax=Rodentibacter ratti TaxID=1906745 RepID=A0A1V3L3Q8_9PAST|nr:phage antirepressor N-terminal domain-containing protein [Rodentibacter ratti]OOF84441.1 antirepressor [Rodentibacter ratti]
MTTQLSTIQFHNQSLVTFEQDGTYYTAMKPICENIGLAWEPQLLRIKRDDVLSSTMIITIIVAEDGKQREMVCLPIDYLNGWLFGIDVKRVKPEIRDTLIMYKKECYKALADYWIKGKAERKTTTDERTGLRQAVSALVSKKGLIYSEAYSLIHQRFNVEHIDELTPEQIGMAVEYVHRIVLEGELIEPKKNEHYSFEFTEHELQQLVWTWFALLRCAEMCQVLYPALRQIGSSYAATVRDLGVEYNYTIRQSQNTLSRITEQFACEPSSNWRVLKYLRAYNPKKSGFQLDIL